MNCGSKSSSPSDADGDRSAQDDARTSPASASPTDAAADRVATGESCAWCGRGPSNDEADFHVDETWPSAADDDDDRRRRSAYDQLRFCSRSCLSRYKMDLFCRETQRYLHQLQGSDRLSSGVGSDDSKEQRILITPELWSQPEPGDEVKKAPNNGKDSGNRRRRRSNDDHALDEPAGPGAARQKAGKFSVSDRLAAARRPGRNSTSDGVQSAYPRKTLSRTSGGKDSSGSIKLECGLTDPMMGSGRSEGLANVSFGLPWMAPTSTPVPAPLTSAFPRGFYAGPLWSQAPPSFPVPPTQVKSPAFAAAASMPLGFGATGWLPTSGLVPPTAMFVPYPIPIPLPLPLPIPIPVPVTKSAIAESSREIRSGNAATSISGDSEGPNKTDYSPRKSSGDTWNASPKSISASPSSRESSTGVGNALDLSTGGGRGHSGESSAAVTWMDARSSTLDASPYLARRSLILDAPVVDRKGFGDHALPLGGGIRAPSLTAVSKRFNHHRRRTTQTPLVKSK